MSSVKLGSVVLFSAFGRSVPAIVLALRSGELAHLGANDEPILTLALIDPLRETGLAKDKSGNPIYPIGRIPNVFIEHDVVHESHEFDEEFKKKHGDSPAQIAAQRGHGEWTEYIPDEAKKLVSHLRDRIEELQKSAEENATEAAKQRARADLAESKLNPSDPA